MVAGARAVIVVGAHFGAIEVPVVALAARQGYHYTAPMETVRDPGLQAWMERTRSSAGIRIVPVEHARRELAATLRAGRSVGLVADRDLTGGGILMPFFGHPAPLPAGPALLAVETGAPLFVGGARRVGRLRYLGRMTLLEVPTEGPRRERVLRSCADRRRVRGPHRPGAGAMVGRLPADLARPRAPWRRHPPVRGADPATASRRCRRRARAAPTCISTRSPRTARPRSARSSTTCERSTALDVIAITDHERIDAAVAARAMAEDRGLRVRGHGGRGGHDARRPPPRAVHRAAGEALPVAARDDRRDPRPGRPRDPRPSRSCPIRCAPRGSSCAGCSPTRIRASDPTRSRRSTRRCSGGRGTPASSRSPRSRPRRASATATPTRRRDRRGWTTFPGRTPTTCAPRSWPARPHQHGTFHAHGRPGGRRSASSCASTAVTCAPRSAAGSGATARARPGLPGRPPAAPPRFDPREATSAAMKIGLVTPVHLPAARRRQRSTSATCTRTSALRGHDVRIISAATASSAPSEGDVIRIG